MSVRFRYFMDRLSELAGGEHIGFSEASEHPPMPWCISSQLDVFFNMA